jgi:hypothetical protein
MKARLLTLVVALAATVLALFNGGFGTSPQRSSR